VGHSLGAGTASLFSLIFHEAHPEIPTHCYAYAPPGVVSPDVALSSSTQELIDSVVVGNDIVPRLSFATLTHLKKIIMQILASGNNTFHRAFQWMAGGMGDGLKGMLKIPEAAKIEPTPVPLSDVTVFPPGRLLLLVPHTLSFGDEGDSGSDSDGEGERELAEIEKEEARKEEERRGGHEKVEGNIVVAQESEKEKPKEKEKEKEKEAKEKANEKEKGKEEEKTNTRNRSSSFSTPQKPSPAPSPTASPSLAPPSSYNPFRRFSQTLSLTPAKLSIFSSTPAKPKLPKPKSVYLMENSNAALFNEIIISPSMFTSHMPSAYDKALDSCLLTMIQIKNSPSALNITVKME